MEWDDQLEAELRHFDVKGFRNGFAGRTMEALNQAVQSGQAYKSISLDRILSQGFIKLSIPSLALLAVLLFLNFGLDYSTPVQQQVDIPSATSSNTQSETFEEWLQYFSYETIAGQL